MMVMIMMICLFGFSIFSILSRSYLHSLKSHKDGVLFASQSAKHNTGSVTDFFPLMSSDSQNNGNNCFYFYNLFRISVACSHLSSHVSFKQSCQAGRADISGSVPRCKDSPGEGTQFTGCHTVSKGRAKTFTKFPSSLAHVPSPAWFTSIWEEKPGRI